MAHISLVEKAQVAQLEEVAQSGRVAESLADHAGALLRAVQVGNQLLQEVPPNLDLTQSKEFILNNVGPHQNVLSLRNVIAISARQSPLVTPRSCAGRATQRGAKTPNNSENGGNLHRAT